ncbi:hypothetical protein N9U43_00395 [Cytophagia bacterium]|nr:hypothetical protein [Cytophagia bacterium]
MKFWESPIIKSLGWKEEPKGIAKVMSVCMLIVIAMAIFMPSSILEIKIVSTITWASIIIFFVLLAYVLLKRLFSK